MSKLQKNNPNQFRVLGCLMLVILIAGLCTGCTSRLGSAANHLLSPPDLYSLQPLAYQGQQGAWMNSQDALALTIWRDLMASLFSEVK